mgnify:CR=1 FL=1
MKKKICILGSTGSIGLTSLKIFKKKNLFNIKVLVANKNYNLICRQIKEYKPESFIISNKDIYNKVKKKFKSSKTKFFNNLKFLNAKQKFDITIAAIPGIAGLPPTIQMIKLSKKILIANKESIICGWNLIKLRALKNKTQIIPIDSEHFSILKLIENIKLSEINKVYITASGGPFLNYKKKQFNKIKPEHALKHPKWKMGKKVTIDSSTLMNKIFEVSEAQKLFNIPNNKLEILIHPNSLVHAIIELKNGIKKFIYHETSMIIPLSNAIFDGNLDIQNFYKTKKNKNTLIENLTFKPVSEKQFPVIKLKKRINEYPSTPIIINASNEILVDHFLVKKIPFLSIFKIIMSILKDLNYKKYAIRTTKNIDQINEIDAWARETTLRKIKNLYG